MFGVCHGQRGLTSGDGAAAVGEIPEPSGVSGSVQLRFIVQDGHGGT